MHGRGEIEEKGKRVWEIETKSVLRATSEENNSILYHTNFVSYLFFIFYHIISYFLQSAR